MKASFQCIRRNSIIFESNQCEQENGGGDIMQVGSVAVVRSEADRFKDEEVFIKSSDEDVFKSETELELNITKQSNSTLRE